MSLSWATCLLGIAQVGIAGGYAQSGGEACLSSMVEPSHIEEDMVRLATALGETAVAGKDYLIAT